MNLNDADFLRQYTDAILDSVLPSTTAEVAERLSNIITRLERWDFWLDHFRNSASSE